MVVLSWYLVFLSFSVQVNPLQVTWLVGTTTIINVLSLVPGGIGVSELAISELLVLQGIAPAKAQVSAVGLRMFVVFILGLTALHLPFWWQLKRKRKP